MNNQDTLFWGVPIKLNSNIYAYDDETNKKDEYLLSQTFIFSPSIDRDVLTTKSYGCEESKPLQWGSNWL